jgi:hypothetical protein
VHYSPSFLFGFLLPPWQKNRTTNATRRSIGDSHPGMRYSDHGAAKAAVRGTTRDPLPSTRTPNRLVK